MLTELETDFLAIDRGYERSPNTTRDWQIVVSREILGKTLSQAGAEFGISRERVRQICEGFRCRHRRHLKGLALYCHLIQTTLTISRDPRRPHHSK